MGKFKKGDKVIINPTLKVDNIYGNLNFFKGMKIPGVVCITDIDEDGYYTVGESGYWYSEEMLLPVPLFKPGDKVVIRKNLKDIPFFPFGLVSEMRKLEGITCTIKSVVSTDTEKHIGFDGYNYGLAEDEFYFSWPSVAFDLSNYKLKNKNYESRLQEQESPLRGGSREVSSRICCRINRARVEISTLGYKKVIGRG